MKNRRIRMLSAVGKGIVALFLIAMGCFFQAEAARAVEGDTGQTFRIGVSSRAFGNVNKNDASAALKAWGEMIKREQNFKGKFDTTLLTLSGKEIRKSFLNGEFDGIGLSVAELKEMDLAPEFVFVGNRGDGIYIRYILITHVEEKIATPRDLAKRKIVTSENNEMVLAEEWLEGLMAEQAPGERIGLPTVVETLPKAIFQVFFHQADAAIVTRESFDLAGELNPQIRKNIKVLWESPPLVAIVFLLKPASGKKADWELLERLVTHIGDTPAGRQMLTVIQSSRMEKCPLSVLDATFDLLGIRERMAADSISKAERE